MDIFAIGERDFSVYICAAELVERHLDPKAFSAGDAAALLEEALPKTGGRMQIELFEGADEFLIFVRLGEKRTEIFAFRDGESLLSAIEECRVEEAELITYINNTFYLLVYPFWEAEAPCGFEEFGERVDAGEEFELFLREHGEFFLRRGEIKGLKNLFSAKIN